MAETPDKKRGLSFYVRITVSLVLFGYVFHKAGLDQIWGTVKQTDLTYLLISALIDL